MNNLAQSPSSSISSKCYSPLVPAILLAAVFAATGVAASPYQDAVLADGPLLYYQFEESGGTTAADSSGNANDGVFANPGSLGFKGTSAETNLGHALEFAGGFVRVPNLGTHAKSSIECWLLLDTPANGCCTSLFSTNGWAPGRVHLNLTSGSVIEHAVNSDVPAGGVDSVSGLATQTWYHLVVTNDVINDETKIYLNGIEVEDTGDHTSQSVVFGATGMQIGAWDGGRLFDGRIDEFAIYDSVLSGSDVAKHFAAASGPDELLEITMITRDGDNDKVALTWNSQLEQVYAVARSVDLITWSDVDVNVTSQGDSTTFEFTEIAPQAYYRVRKLP